MSERDAQYSSKKYSRLPMWRYCRIMGLDSGMKPDPAAVDAWLKLCIWVVGADMLTVEEEMEDEEEP
jgi:hypothetical protein